LIVQLVPAQLSPKRLVEPSGVGPSPMVEAPPPMLRPPQVRFLTTALLPSRAVPQVPPAAPRAKSRTVGAGGGVVRLKMSSEKASTLASSAGESPVVRQSFGTFASSFWKQPFVGST